MAEKEYIERSALINEIRGLTTETWGKGLKNGWWSHSVQIKDNFILLIEKSPAADVDPVVHARWITEDNTEGYKGDPHCTACKYILRDEAVYGCTPGVDDYFYCPNCGAKMDGGTNG